MVIMIERRVIVEQSHPKVLVRSSKRSDLSGQMPYLIGVKIDEAGTHVYDCMIPISLFSTSLRWY